MGATKQQQSSMYGSHALATNIVVSRDFRSFEKLIAPIVLVQRSSEDTAQYGSGSQPQLCALSITTQPTLSPLTARRCRNTRLRDSAKRTA